LTGWRDAAGIIKAPSSWIFSKFAGVTFRLPDAAGGGFLSGTEHPDRLT
jgi:hypothetical protein